MIFVYVIMFNERDQLWEKYQIAYIICNSLSIENTLRMILIALIAISIVRGVEFLQQKWE